MIDRMQQTWKTQTEHTMQKAYGRVPVMVTSMRLSTAADLTFVSAPQGWYAAKQSYESRKGDEENRKRNLPKNSHNRKLAIRSPKPITL